MKPVFKNIWFPKFKTILLFGLLIHFLFKCDQLYCQKRKIEFDRITTKEGLSHSTVTAIRQDSKGFMWFGTYGGLNKYDGHRFTIFRTEPGNLNSVFTNAITTICEDIDGSLWVGTFGGLNKFDPHTNKFKRYSSIKLKNDSINGFNAYCINVDSFQNLWVGTNYGLYKYDREQDDFINFFKGGMDANPFSEEHIQTMFVAEGHTLWLGTINKGLYEINYNTREVRNYRSEPNNKHSLSHNFVKSIYVEKAGFVWIGTYGGGLNKLNVATGEFIHFRKELDKQSSLGNDFINAIYKDKQGKLYVGTAEGLDILNIKTGEFYHYRDEGNEQASISNNNILSIFKDQSGLLWVGLDGGGVCRSDMNKKKFYNYSTGKNDSMCLSNKMVFSIREDSNGIIWIGTYGGGLNYLNPITNRIKHFFHNPGNPYSLSSNKILSVNVGISGNLWIGTDGEGLDKFVLNDLQFKTEERFYNFKHNSDIKNSISHNVTYTVLEDRKNNVWVGTWGEGLNKLIPVSRTKESHNSGNQAGEYIVKRFKYIPEDENSLSNNVVFTLYEDKEGTIWIGLNGGGLNKLVEKEVLINGETQIEESFISYKTDSKDSTSLNDNGVFSIFESKNGDFWVGTAAGLNKFERDNETFKAYTVKDGLPDNVIFGILEDNNGNLWLGTHGGISKFNPVDETFKNYSYKDGLQDNVFNPDAFCKTNSGYMYFGGPNGITAFHPDSIIDNNYQPKIMLTDFKILNKTVQIGEVRAGRVILGKTISTIDEIILTHKDYVFSFEFSASHYAVPSKNQYAYIMEGFDEGWNYIGYKRTATYTNLDPGTYVFKVKATNNDGVWNEEGISLRVIVLPPWWKTWWFRSVAFVFILSILVLFYFYRLNSLKNQKRILKKMVNERTSELQETNKILEASREEIHNKNKELEASEEEYVQLNEELSVTNELLNTKNDELENTLNALKETQSQLVQSEKMASLGILTAGIAHEINNPLNFIKGGKYAIEEYIINNFNEHIDKLAPLINMIEQGVERTSEIINSLNRFNRESSAKKECCVIEPIIENCLTILQNHIKHKITIKKQYTINKYDLIGNESELHQVILNILTNAVQAIPEKGDISIQTKIENKKLIIIVEDTGVGISKENILKIADPFYTTKAPGVGTGLGMSIAYSIIKQHNGRIEYKSKLEKGTQVTLSLPIK